MVIGDHPREYGENDYIFGNLDIIGGSSPRIRGELPLAPTPFRTLGIIPANTGRIYAAAPPCLARRDHPREYGENFQPHLN